MAHITLKPQRDEAPRRGHPWIFYGSVQSVPASVRDGDIVDVCGSAGQFIGRGYYNHASQIVVRLLTWDPQEAIDADFWARRLEAAIRRREQLLDTSATNAYRLVFAEADALPGLIVDRYADCLVVQFLTFGLDQRKDLLAFSSRSPRANT
jgi:23S rRNA (cytosine1962-C5)-methyltransferase